VTEVESLAIWIRFRIRFLGKMEPVGLTGWSTDRGGGDRCLSQGCGSNRPVAARGARPVLAGGGGADLDRIPAKNAELKRKLDELT
jgi:hypothetical protein